MTSQNVTTTRSTGASMTGWIIKSLHGYYTGIERSQLERWTAFPKLARVYTRQAWAQRAAERVAGQVIPAGPGRMATKNKA